MIIDLPETKKWLRVDGTDEDTTITLLIGAAETYLKNATGNDFGNSNQLAKLFCMVLVTDWFENREMVGRVSEKVRLTVESILAQLSYCYDTAPAAPIGLTATAGVGSVDLSWAANTEVDVAGYHVYQDLARITTIVVTGTSAQVTGLTAGTNYSFQITAIDTGGNESALSAAVTVTPT